MCEYRRVVVLIILSLLGGSAFETWPRPRTGTYVLCIGTPCEWEGVQGTCENFWTCYTNAIDAIKGNHPPVCSISNGEVSACCTSCDLVANISSLTVLVDYGIVVEKTGKKSVDKCLDYMRLHEYPCHLTTRVLHKYYRNMEQCYNYFVGKRSYAVRGRNAKRAEFPHMALLGYGEELDAQWLCGGSIVSERYILTAAHCREHEVLGAVRYVSVGILKRSDPREMWQVYRVDSFIPHPDYLTTSSYHDIALVKTDRRILMGRSVVPACLPQGHEDAASAEATGWGATHYRGQLADVLQTVTVSQYNASRCAEHYGPHRRLSSGYNHTTQMCYGDPDVGRDTCEGDSGGPLQLASCPHVVIGVTSSGHPCGFADSPGLYTRVLHYVPWIEDIVWP